METQASESQLALQLTPLITATATDSQKAWHIFALLFSLGRPAPASELASKCTLFRANPEFIRFLCEIPNSPLYLTRNCSVTISSTGYGAISQFVSNAHVNFTILPQRGFKFELVNQSGVFGVDNQLRTNNRKRKRSGSDSNYSPLVKLRTSFEDDEENQAAPQICGGKESASSSQVYILDDNTKRSFNMWLSDPSCARSLRRRFEKVGQEKQIDLCMKRKELHFATNLKYDRIPLMIERPLDFTFHQLKTPLISTQVDENHPTNKTALLCLEVDKEIFHESIYACTPLLEAVESMQENEKEPVIHNETCNKPTELTQSLPQEVAKEITKPESKIDSKEGQNSKSRDIYKKLEKNKVLSASTDQSKRGKKQISSKQKTICEENNDCKEKKQKHKEKPVLVSANNKQERKEFPNFELYVVEEEEGSGGYGTVYRAKRKSDGVKFAIKCPHSNANKYHVQNEVKMLERFGGKNFVIKYEGSVKLGDSDCLVLEHVEHDRPEVLRREIDVSQLQWYGFCIFKALAGLHKQGIVHRDVKPGNFLFSRKANKGYLIDFNLAIDLPQKYVITDRKRGGNDFSSSNHGFVPLFSTNSLPPIRNERLRGSRHLDLMNNEAALKASKSLALPKGQKRKIDETKEYSTNTRNSLKSQGADRSGVTSTKDIRSNRVPMGGEYKPIQMQGRKELLSIIQDVHNNNNSSPEVANNNNNNTPASKRKRIAATPGNRIYLSPMPLHSTGIPVSGAGMLKSKGDGNKKQEGPCVGTKGFRAPEVLFRSTHQGAKIDIWSVGVTLLYLIMGKSTFIGDPDQNIKEIAKLKGSEELWEVAKLHNRESSFPVDLFDIKYLPSIKLREWCKLYTRRTDFFDSIPSSLFDLIDKCLAVNPRLRLSAEEALRHEFFSSCHATIEKKRTLRQALTLDIGKQTQTCEDIS